MMGHFGRAVARQRGLGIFIPTSTAIERGETIAIETESTSIT
jgi:hypothetical protein